MDKLPSEAVAVLTCLLPGLAATAVFYALTLLPKPDALNRIAHPLMSAGLSDTLADVMNRVAGYFNGCDGYLDHLAGASP